MRKITLVLKNATEEDIRKIQDFCHTNSIETHYTDMTGQTASSPNNVTTLNYYFYIISDTYGFNQLNEQLDGKLMTTGYANIGNIADSDDAFLENLSECMDTMKNSLLVKEKADDMFANLLKSINNIEVLKCLFSYTKNMDAEQEKMLKNRLVTCATENQEDIQDFIDNLDSARNIRELREKVGMNRKQFCDYFGIPYRTVEDWENGKSTCASYLYDALAMILEFNTLFKR